MRPIMCMGEKAGLVTMSSDEKKTIGHIATGDLQVHAPSEIVY